MSDKSEFPDMDTGYVDNVNADRDIIAAECQRLRSDLSQIRKTLQEGIDRDIDDTTTPHLAVVAVNALAQIRAEVERLRSRVEWFEKSGGVTAHVAYFQMERQRDQWREVAGQLFNVLKHWYPEITKSPETEDILAAYERLVKGSTP